MHYSWNTKEKIFNVYQDGCKVGNMWWVDAELFFKCEGETGGNSQFYKEVINLIEQIEYEQFGK